MEFSIQVKIISPNRHRVYNRFFHFKSKAIRDFVLYATYLHDIALEDKLVKVNRNTFYIYSDINTIIIKKKNSSKNKKRIHYSKYYFSKHGYYVLNDYSKLTEKILFGDVAYIEINEKGNKTRFIKGCCNSKKETQVALKNTYLNKK